MLIYHHHLSIVTSERNPPKSTLLHAKAAVISESWTTRFFSPPWSGRSVSFGNALSLWWYVFWVRMQGMQDLIYCCISRYGLALRQSVNVCVVAYVCTIMLLVQNGTTHHLSVHPSEKSPAVTFSAFTSVIHTYYRWKGGMYIHIYLFLLH